MAGGGNQLNYVDDPGYGVTFPYDPVQEVDQLILLDVDEQTRQPEPFNETEVAIDRKKSLSKSQSHDKKSKKKKDCKDKSHKKSYKKKKDYCKDIHEDPCRDPCRHHDKYSHRDPCEDPCKDPCKDPCTELHSDPCNDPCNDPCKQKDWGSQRSIHSHSFKDPCEDRAWSSHRSKHGHSRYNTRDPCDSRSGISQRSTHSHSMKDCCEDVVKDPCGDKVFQLHRVAPPCREKRSIFDRKKSWEETVWLTSRCPEKPGSIIKVPTEDMSWTSQRPASKYSAIVDPENAMKLSMVTPTYSLVADPIQKRQSSRVPTIKYHLVPDCDQSRKQSCKSNSERSRKQSCRSKYSTAVEGDKKSKCGSTSIGGVSAETGSSFVILDNDLSPLHDGTMSIAGVAEPEALGFANIDYDERPMQQCPTRGIGWKGIIGRIARLWASRPKYKTRILYRNDLEYYFETAYNWSGMDIHGHEIYLTSGNIISVYNFKGELVREIQCQELEQAWDIKEYDSLLYISDCAVDKKVILVMDKNGHVKSRIGLPGLEVGLEVWPLGIAVDKKNNDLYVCSCYSQTVFKCPNGKGRFKKFIKKGLANPRYMWVGPRHEVLVSNAGNHSVCKFNSWGHLIWRYGEKGSDNGQLDTPGGVCTDEWGNVYIADTNNNRIIHLTSKGKLVTNINIGHIIEKPQSVVFDATNLIVTTGLMEPELTQNRIYIIDCTYQRIQIHDVFKK